MKRGEIWTVTGSGYAQKPRPAIIIQSEQITRDFDSVVIIGLTSNQNSTTPIRVPIMPDTSNGLKALSYAMTEKPLTVKKTDLGKLVGHITQLQLRDIERSLLIVLGIN